jgi:hypothetical protein
MKIKINLQDPETRKVWEAVLEARREVASWPAWKRGEYAATAEEGPDYLVNHDPGDEHRE